MKNIIEFLFYGSVEEQMRGAAESIVKILDKPIVFVIIVIAVTVEIILYIKELL